MQDKNVEINRRQFMSGIAKGTALFLAPSILTSFLAGCKREEIPFQDQKEALRKLANLPRRSDDIFTYFVHSDIDIAAHGQLKKCSKSFRSSKVVFKSNFNLFDGIYSGMLLNNTVAKNNQVRYSYSHPVYPRIDFYIQRFEMEKPFSLPKKTENILLIHPELINKQLSKYNVPTNA